MRDRPRWAPLELVSSALNRDERAVEGLIAAIWPGCFRLAATILVDRDLAQDAAQEACVIVHRKIGGLRSAEAFDAWLYRVIVRETARVRRRQRTSDCAPDLAANVGDSTSIDVWRALAELSPQFREVTVLFYFDDLKTEEIATILGVPHATVRTRLARSRTKLRQILGDYDDRLDLMSGETPQHAV
jgi:RNA polymerase sigma-70 factor (ECF subfamily)